MQCLTEILMVFLLKHLGDTLKKKKQKMQNEIKVYIFVSHLKAGV